MAVGVVPAGNGLPAIWVRAPEEPTVKPEMVPCEGQVEGVAGGVGVDGGAVVTTTELVLLT